MFTFFGFDIYSFLFIIALQIPSNQYKDFSVLYYLISILMKVLAYSEYMLCYSQHKFKKKKTFGIIF